MFAQKAAPKAAFFLRSLRFFSLRSLHEIKIIFRRVHTKGAELNAKRAKKINYISKIEYSNMLTIIAFDIGILV
jgi:hypothetical protein